MYNPVDVVEVVIEAVGKELTLIYTSFPAPYRGKMFNKSDAIPISDIKAVEELLFVLEYTER
jgi:hypothetical protein